MNANGTAAVPVASSEELTSTFGVLLIGFILSVVLYGLTFFQTYIYYTRFPSDHMGTKLIVGILWATDTTATTLISHTIYRYLITSFMFAFEQLTTTKTFTAEETLSIFLILLVQSYYAFRVWTITDRRIAIAAVIGTLALASCALNLAGVAEIAEQEMFWQIVTNSVKLFRSIGNALAAVADLIIVSSMFYYMQPSRNPGMAKAEGWYDKTIVFGFNRGTAFTIVQLISLLIFVTMPHSQTWIPASWVTSKVYINSALAMLNFRNTHRGRGVHEEDSLNQAASNRSGSVSVPVVGPRETTRSVQFSVSPDVKTRDPMSVIELEMVGSPADGYDDDDSGKRYGDWLDAGEA